MLGKHRQLGSDERPREGLQHRREIAPIVALIFHFLDRILALLGRSPDWRPDTNGPPEA